MTAITLYRFAFKALGGANELQLYAASAEEARQCYDLVYGEVQRIEAKYSRYQQQGVVAEINRQAGQEKVGVDSETAALIQYAATCFQQSSSLFDITSGVLRRAWNFTSGQLPTAHQIQSCLELIGWQKVEWQPPYFRLPIPGMEIDFGGLGKEYAVDRAAGLCQEQGYINVLINLGGDVRAVGPQLGGEPWRIGITHPRLPGQAIAVVNLLRGAVATSGDYERFLEHNGQRYCHILNPRTGWPVQGFQSVSVQAESCLVAGSATTIAMLHEERRGRKFLQELGLPAHVVSRSGEANFIK